MKISINNKIVVEEPTGDRFVSVKEMVLFSYLSDSRRWQVLLKDESNCLMQRIFKAKKILALSSNFTKLNPHTIVNMEFIKSIGAKDKKCILVKPFESIELTFSRRAIKKARRD